MNYLLKMKRLRLLNALCFYFIFVLDLYWKVDAAHCRFKIDDGYSCRTHTRISLILVGTELFSFHL